MQGTSQYMKAKDVAEYFNVSPKHIYRLVADGLVRSVRVGRVVRISRDDLMQAIERGKVGTEPEPANATEQDVQRSATK